MKYHLYLLACVSTLIFSHLFLIHLTQFHLAKQFIQKPILISGVIDSIPIKKPHAEQFQFHANTIEHKKISAEFLLSFYHTHHPLEVGQRWQFIATLKPPIGSHNPGGFDYADFLKSKNISATGFINPRHMPHFMGTNHIYFLAQFREHIRDEIKNVIPDHAISAFISALCVGLRDGLTERDWQVFQKTGTNHLVAIAGLHIGFVAALFYFVTNLVWRLSEKTMLIIPAQRAASVGGLIGALCYTTLSGFAIPAERASIMLFFLLLGNITGIQLSIWRRLFFAAAIILILFPLDLSDSSFWMSFISIGILAWVLTGRCHASHGAVTHIKMQVGILIGLLPAMILFFQQLSLIAFFTNMIAIPWVGFIILPITVLACACYFFHVHFLSQKLFWLAGKCLEPLWRFLGWSAHFSWASWHTAISNHFILLSAMIGVIFLLAPRGLSGRILGCYGLLPLFFYHHALLKPGEFRMTVIDVGQGLSVLIQTRHHVMLYDTGAHFPGGFDYGESVVAPYLRFRHVKKINRLEISHGDNDHSGGAAAIIRDFTVQSIFTSAPKLIKRFHAQHCFAGQNWRWDGVTFQTLSPMRYSPYEDNNSSCVVQISNGKASVLLTGDIQKTVEYDLVSRYEKKLKSTVLVVPHHGSKTSSSRLFLETVSPVEAIVSSGKYNRYHLPAPNIVTRYINDRIKLYNTADSGAIIVRFLLNGQVKSRITHNE